MVQEDFYSFLNNLSFTVKDLDHSSPFCASFLLVTNWDPQIFDVAQILHLSNFFELKRTLVYIHLQ